MVDQRIIRKTKIGWLKDLGFYTYNQTQLNEFNPLQINFAASAVKPSNYFVYDGKNWCLNNYPGYAVVSMVDNNPGNEELPSLLIGIQNELRYNLQPLNAFYMLPTASFHQTIANTLSTDRFKENVLAAGLDEEYPGYIEKAFINAHVTRQTHPISMRLLGLAIFGTALGVLGIFEDEADYKRITDFRSGFYEDAQLNSLDVKMTRPFIGHITLGYAVQKLNKNQKEHLANTVNEINEQMFSKKQYFHISRTESRRYDHLAEFKTQDNYPIYTFKL